MSIFTNVFNLITRNISNPIIRQLNRITSFFNMPEPEIEIEPEPPVFNQYDIIEDFFNNPRLGNQLRINDLDELAYALTLINRPAGLSLIFRSGRNNYKVFNDLQRFINLSNILNNEGIISFSDAAVIGLNGNEIGDISFRWDRAAERRIEGAFFKYINTTKYDLSKYGVYKTIEERNYKQNCFVSCFENESKELFSELRNSINQDYFPRYRIPKVVANINRCIELTSLREKTNEIDHLHYCIDGKKYKKSRDCNNKIKIGLIKSHYFINEETRYKRKKVYEYLNKKTTKNDYITSFNLINLLLKNNKFEPIIMTNEVLQTTMYKKIDNERVILDKEITNLCYKKWKPKKFNNNKTLVPIFFDTETTTDEDYHKVFAISYYNPYIEEIKCVDSPSRMFKDIFEYVKENDKPIFIAHNLGYDFSCLLEYIGVKNIIKTGSSIKKVTAVCKYGDIELLDSYSFISKPLRQFGKMFDLEQEKEVFPYQAYNKETINQDWISVDYALQFLKEEEKPLFLENLKRLNLFFKNKTYFLHKVYARYYCSRDVEVLRDGFNKFRKWVLEAIDIDILDNISIPQISKKFMENQKCFNNVYYVKGLVREFIQKSIQGGRVMTANNEKIKLEDCLLEDFDACSLYPSAMARMKGFPKGKPKIITEEMIQNGEVEKQDAYFVEIEILDVERKLKFPILSYVDNEGKRINSNDYRGRIYVNNITLEDMVNYQGVKYKIIQGVYFNEGFNKSIKRVMKNLYQLRTEKKKEKNPIQEVYKLLLNASYGKLIQKPIDKEIKFIKKEGKNMNIEKFFELNENSILKWTETDYNAYIFEVRKAIFDCENMVHCGSLVLSWSKRIMNEVMCLAEDLGINIYYTDTDSMQIEAKGVPILAKEFKKIYKRELIGNDLGQFHGDYDNPYEKEGYKNAKGVKAIFLGKKAYMVKIEIENDKGDKKYIYHTRMKGIPLKNLQENPEDTYEKLYNGEEVEFDLLKHGVVFRRRDDYRMKTITKFNRRIKF